MHLGWVFFFFFNDTATTEIYTLSLHDALPIYDDHLRRHRVRVGLDVQPGEAPKSEHDEHEEEQDDQRPALQGEGDDVAHCEPFRPCGLSPGGPPVSLCAPRGL